MAIRFRPESQEGRRASGWPGFLVSLGLGAAAAYVLDPSNGRGRRARARDKASKLARTRGRQVRRFEHDLSNRAHGIVARVRSALEPRTPDDEVVRERVRSALGRVCSHPGAIEVSVAGGNVCLSGPIFDHEHDRVLRKLGHVPGVRAIRDELSRHVGPSGVPGLQESGRHATPRAKHYAVCADIMKRKVRTVREDDTVNHAAELMAMANIGFLPVCDPRRKVVGTITDRDIVVRVLAKGLQSATVPVSEAMTPEVVTCRPDDEVSVAEQFMAQHQVSRMVITDEEGRLEGVISLSDFAEREPARRVVRTLRAVAAREAQVM